MIKEGFRFYKPCERLRPYVRYYWVFGSRRLLNTFTFPVGCPQIIFHKRSPLYVPELDVMQSRLTVSGQVDFSSHLCADGDVEMIVAVFRPHAMKAFLNMPISLFYNREVSGYDIEHKSLADLASRIFECADNDSCIRLIEEWLMARIAGCASTDVYNAERVGAAVCRICSAEQASVAELAAVACLGKRQFERLFNWHVGMNPKEYMSIVRFQKALRQMQLHSAEICYAQIACASGYADQSHMIREFRRLCGHTPVSLLKETNPYSDLFADPV
ncbi:MAG: helix-turn-helix domain-containing protein [Alistipes sp.]|nr:helix-turn-helix domain-containing protein [Alistipes sp.]